MRENQQNFAIKLDYYKNPGEIVSRLGSVREKIFESGILPCNPGGLAPVLIIPTK
jgi:hypothetical protein